MRNGTGHALHARRCGRRSGRQASRPAADRCRHSFSGAVRHDRREPDADGGRAGSRRAARRRGSRRTVPVLAGAGGYDTKEVIHSARRMQQAGADGILSVTPYYNKPDAGRSLSALQRRSPGEVGLPIVVYNVPGRTGCNVDAATLVRLSARPGIVAVKEASGNISQMVEICGAVPKDFIVLSGDDALTLPLMAVGGHGLISVAGNEVPRRDGAHGRARRSGRLCRRAADPQPAAAAHAGQLHRVESRFRSRARWRPWGCSKRCTGCRWCRRAGVEARIRQDVGELRPTRAVGVRA